MTDENQEKEIEVTMHHFVDADGNYKGAWDTLSLDLVDASYKEVPFAPSHASQVWDKKARTYGPIPRIEQLKARIIDYEWQKADRVLVYGDQDATVIEINAVLQNLRNELNGLERN